MMKVALIFLLFVAIAITDGGEVCKDILKALIEARHGEYHRKILSLKSKFTKELKDVQDRLKAIKSGTGYGSYVRWGRKTCPKGAEFVYRGYIGGNYYDLPGGSSLPVCLPERPEYGLYQSGRNGGGFIYGTEYETTYFSIFKNLHNHEAPCVVCKTPRTAVIMIPAKNTCTKGWTREYHGYLMSGHHNHKSSADYICVDRHPTTATGTSSSNHNGNLLYGVEATCGSLKCPPYNNDKELTCVVCSA